MSSLTLLHRLILLYVVLGPDLRGGRPPPLIHHCLVTTVADQDFGRVGRTKPPFPLPFFLPAIIPFSPFS